MKTKLLLFFLLMLTTKLLMAQEKVTLSGYIKDASNGEGLIGAAVLVKELQTGVVTNEYGFYSLTLKKGTYSIVFSYVGYSDSVLTMEMTANKSFNIELNPDLLDEVEITSEAEDENVSSIEMSVNKLDMSTLEKLPAFLGEVDVIRSIQLLPGVTTVGEGASGFNVRGGAVDQNLILLDEAPVFNSSHLFGFFSVFNPDAVKDVKLVKGGIPAIYGGRLSSLLDVRMKDGNSKNLNISGGVGVIFSRLTVEAPIVKDKASFIVAARRSYIDVLAQPFLKGDLKDSKFNFYDITAKTNWQINQNNKVFISSYFGRDVFSAPGFLFNWGNSTATARWNHIFSNKLFLNTTAFYSNYDYELGFGETEEDRFRWASNIKNYSFKPEFSYYLNTDNKISFGGQSILFRFQPGNATFTSNGESNDISLPDKYALETAFFIDNEQTLSDRISLQYGIRYSMYHYLGTGKAISYNDTTPGVRKTIASIEEFGKGEVIQTYGNWEPRFSMKLQLSSSSSIKASYNRMAQYLHLISNTTASTPLDVWTPSTNNIKPQIANQVSLGYFKNFAENTYEFSIEVYYKALQNQIDYIDGADLLLNEFLEADLLSGIGRAYGAEFFVKKAKGKLTGWISYTLARTERQVNGINNSEWFPNRFDKPHNVSVVATYDRNDRWSFSANFVFASGTPATFPTNKVVVQGWTIPHNSDAMRNNYRIPPYHRLDLSATRYNKPKGGRLTESYWVFSVYNVYNRKNPFSVFFQTNENDPTQTEAIKYSVLGSFVPAVAYNFGLDYGKSPRPKKEKSSTTEPTK